MEFFKGLISALFLTGFMLGVLYFAKEFGIKRGREIASKEYGKKLNNCNQIITGK